MEKMNTIIDNHGRPINYLRLAVTDRCNLRCFYCMPEEGIKYLPRKELLSYEEMERVIAILSKMGVNKIRITGGEPFVRQDLIPFLQRVRALGSELQLSITTNGILTGKYIEDLKKLDILKVNLSLDTLDRERFKAITRRDEFEVVKSTLHELMANQFSVKVNMVVMEDHNLEDIIPMVELTRNYDINVRFIEEMPFNGEGVKYSRLTWTHAKILNHIQSRYDNIVKLKDEPNSTSSNYKVSDYKGSFGIIAAYSRTFCGSCNRIRITAQGILKTCLYDGGALNVKELVRSTFDDDIIAKELISAFSSRYKDGFEAEKNRLPIHESMSTIGG
ncbi:MAG: GTP 3',8-cyclase MoaA [Flavobacteriaceae bacterium]|nr:GTP 3',8-cyclase MoaA [Flavobacteriaceae bacterium]